MMRVSVIEIGPWSRGMLATMGGFRYPVVPCEVAWEIAARGGIERVSYLSGEQYRDVG